MATTRAADDAVPDRRTAVLRSAMATFARYGYSRTTMELVARDAGISRQGLYFLFESKPELFQQAVEQTLRADLEAAQRCLRAGAIPLRDRLVQAFDHWAGRYVGPLTREVTTVIEDNPALVGPWVRSAPEEFARSVLQALRRDVGQRRARRIAPTLISASIGIKHQVDDRAVYIARVGDAVDVLLDSAAADLRPGPTAGRDPDGTQAVNSSTPRAKSQ